LSIHAARLDAADADGLPNAEIARRWSASATSMPNGLSVRRHSSPQ
jgi:hypothetical protein